MNILSVNRMAVSLRFRYINRMLTDRVLAGLSECCLPALGPWSARKVADRLDKIAGIPAMEETMARILDSPGFPEVDELMTNMGVTRRGRRVVIDQNAPLAFLARSIMGQQPEAVARSR